MSDESLLQAPCRWCGYNGRDYWHPDTHNQGCPWNGVGGAVQRLAMLAADRIKIPGPWPSPKPDLGPRQEWPRVMMGMAMAAATRSRDATTRVGAVVCTSDWRVLGTGYNGPPAGSPESLVMSGPDRHGHVVHAEVNAVLQAIASQGRWPLEKTLCVCTHRPCARCVQFLAHCGVTFVIWAFDELSDEQRSLSESWRDAMKVTCAQLEPRPGGH